MWILVLIVCGDSCAVTQIPGYYTDKKVCEEAVATYSAGDANWISYRRSAYCIPAPDNLGIE